MLVANEAAPPAAPPAGPASIGEIIPPAIHVRHRLSALLREVAVARQLLKVAEQAERVLTSAPIGTKAAPTRKGVAGA